MRKFQCERLSGRPGDSHVKLMTATVKKPKDTKIAHIASPLGFAIVCLLVGLLTVPAGLQAGMLVAARDDAPTLAEHMLDHSFDSAVAKREIESALDAKDPDLAGSFLELAQDRHVPVDPALADKVRSAKDEA